ncbi:MAG: RNA polymerase sigma factor [Nannocystales bacterium]
MSSAPATATSPQAPPPALRALFEAHYDFVYRSALRLGVTHAAVDDVVQETFIVAGRKLEAFEGRSAVRTWLFGILMRVAHTERRGERRRQRRAAVVVQTSAVLDEPFERRDAADTLHRLLALLDEDRRAAFILADVEGMTAVEISAGLGVNVNTIYARIRAARKQLADAYRELSEEGGR